MIISAFFGFLWNFAFLSQQNKEAFFTLLAQYQQVFKRLVSAFRRRRRRRRLNRARFSSKPSLVEVSSSSIVTVWNWDHISYFAFFFSCRSFCTNCAGFDNSSGRRSTRWSWLFDKFPPMTGPRVRVGHSFKFLVPLKRKLKVRWTRKKIVSFHRRRQITLADHSVFFPLKFYLSDMSRGRWQLNGLKNKIVWSWCSWQDISSYEYWRNLGDPQIFDKVLKLEVAFILRYLVFFIFSLLKQTKQALSDPSLST